MNETITLKEAGKALGYKDTRSAIKWCEANQVMVFSEVGTKRKYIIRTQFQYARMKQFINYLKVRYKGQWLDAFQSYSSMNITRVVELEEMGKVTFSITDKYKPKGNKEKSFLKVLSKEINEI